MGAAAVVRAVFEEYGFTWDEAEYCADLYDLEGAYLAQGNYFWVAEADGRLIGTCGLELFSRLPGEIQQKVQIEGKVRAAGADCSLERLYVHPASRGIGVGSALISTCIETARRLGRTAMEIWSDKKLTNAHKMYGLYGAHEIGDRICDDPDESPEWGFVIPL